MIITTTPSVEGHTITSYLGVVASDVILGANVVRDFLASMRDFFGGRSAAYEKVFADARRQALDEIASQAETLHADAIVGLDFDYEVIGKGGSMLLVSVSGTAVLLR
jgi:uncharacterized protein YbjQ (UPF0145 family)